jgi:hypothetical protein
MAYNLNIGFDQGTFCEIDLWNLFTGLFCKEEVSHEKSVEDRATKVFLSLSTPSPSAESEASEGYLEEMIKNYKGDLPEEMIRSYFAATKPGPGQTNTINDSGTDSGSSSLEYSEEVLSIDSNTDYSVSFAELLAPSKESSPLTASPELDTGSFTSSEKVNELDEEGNCARSEAEEELDDTEGQCTQSMGSQI